MITRGTVTTAPGPVSTFRVLWPANTTGVNIKATPGEVCGWFISNVANAPRFVKLYDKATAPTVGTDTPTQTLTIPAQQTVNLGVAANVIGALGLNFLNGIGVGVTVNVTDADTTAPGTNDIVLNIFYV